MGWDPAKPGDDETVYLVDVFSGKVADLKPAERDAQHVLAALRKDPLVSTWDMSEVRWLRVIIESLLKSGRLIDRSGDAGYPWHKFIPATDKEGGDGR